MPDTLNDKLVVAISSRALFNLEAGHKVFEEEGLEAYRHYQVEHEDCVLEPGEAFPLVRKLLNINHLLGDVPRVEVILLSRNSADTGLRVFNSIEEYGLDIRRAAFCGGESPYRYVPAFNSHLFLSTDVDDVRSALKDGFAAATVLSSISKERQETDELRIAFDGDAVIFSDEAERVYQQSGLQAFTEAERSSAHQPLPGGPFKPFLAMLQDIQLEFGERHCPIRTALVTARSTTAHERVIRTLRSWNIRLDEAIFLGGLDKGAFLKAFQADMFFDDQVRHCDSARAHVTTGHVPHGVTNELKERVLDTESEQED